jgi:hypothetical protein
VAGWIGGQPAHGAALLRRAAAADPPPRNPTPRSDKDVVANFSDLLAFQLDALDEEAEERRALGTARRARKEALDAMGGPVTTIENPLELEEGEEGEEGEEEGEEA